MSVRTRSLLALAAAVTLGALAAGPATAAPAATTTTTTDPATAVAGWLAQQFVGTRNVPSPSGDHFESSYGFDGGTTADAIFALAAAHSGQTKIHAAISYFAAHVAAYTSVQDTSGKPGPYDGQVAKSALAAIVAGANPTAFGGYNLLRALKRDECTETSGSTTDFTVPTCPGAGAGRNIFSSVSESLVILAEARGAKTHGVGYAPSAAAVSYFLTLQCPDGGFTIDTAGGSGCGPDVDATGYAVAALLALGGHPGPVHRALAWLAATRSPGGYWTAQGGPDVDSTGLAASALDAAGVHAASSRRWLASQQVTAGPTVGAGASRGALKYQGRFNAFSSIKASADGLLGMVHGASLATLTASGATAGTAVLALAAARPTHPSVAQGDSQSVTGTGFAAGEHVSGVLHSGAVALRPATANASGTATVTFTVPATLPAGGHTVVLTGVTSGLSSAATFTVLAGPSLAATGLDGTAALSDALLGTALVISGAGALYAGRRRRA